VKLQVSRVWAGRGAGLGTGTTVTALVDASTTGSIRATGSVGVTDAMVDEPVAGAENTHESRR
jgi:hypothetical protein